MEIFLSILKIIGIVLLCILAFLLLVLLLIVLVPYRYKVYGEKKEGISAYAKVTWLLHFVVVLLTYDSGGINLKLKILGICFFDKKKRAEKAKLKEEKRRLKEKKRAEAEAKRKKKKKPAAEEEAETVFDKTREEDTDTVSEEKDTVTDTDKDEEAGGGSAEKEPSGKEKRKKKKKPFLEWAEEIFDKTEDLLDKLPDMIEEGGEALFEKLEAIKQKITDIFEKIEYYHRLLTSEGAEWVYEYVKKHVIAILKAVRPTRFDAMVNIADDDPAAVAKVYEYEVYALPLIELIRGKRGKVIINAYQDDKYFDFDATLKGRVLLLPIGIHGLAIILNKKVKAFIKRLKREEEGEEKKKNG